MALSWVGATRMGIFHWWKTKSKKSAKWITTVQCTQKPRGMTLRNHTSRMPNRINSVPWMHAVTSTPYHEWTRSNQLRTMNERGHTNSVPWMNAFTPTPYYECTQFVNSVKPLLFRPIAFIHGTELMQFGKVALRSTKIKNHYGSNKSTLDPSTKWSVNAFKRLRNILIKFLSPYLLFLNCTIISWGHWNEGSFQNYVVNGKTDFSQKVIN